MIPTPMLKSRMPARHRVRDVGGELDVPEERLGVALVKSEHVERVLARRPQAQHSGREQLRSSGISLTGHNVKNEGHKVARHYFSQLKIAEQWALVEECFGRQGADLHGESAYLVGLRRMSHLNGLKVSNDLPRGGAGAGAGPGAGSTQA